MGYLEKDRWVNLSRRALKVNNKIAFSQYWVNRIPIRKNRRYEGIVVTKQRAYKNGCRPVLYLSDEELKLLGIPEDELWRVVRLEAVDGTGVNWVHEREWRCKGNFKLPSKLLAALVQTTKEPVLLRDHIASGFFNYIPGSIIPLEILCQGLPYLAAK